MSDLKALFQRHGLRCTTQRAEIYRALAATKAHPTADELFQAVRLRRPGLSLATVYNTLDALARRGLCRKFTDLEGGQARWDADTTEHVHFVSEDGRVRDVPPEMGTSLSAALPATLIDEIERRMGVRVDRVRIELLGENLGRSGC